MKKINKDSGFTLMELVVSVGIIVILMGVVTVIMLNSFKAKTKNELMEAVNKNGTRAMTEIRRNIINALEDGITCSAGIGSSLAVLSFDGQTSLISCLEVDNIASSSATNGVVSLLGNEVRVRGCGNFVSCDNLVRDPSKVSKVNIKFLLEAGTAEAGVGGFASKEFDLEVTVRD
jgi:prepilin-type N-terminal cleavage/methylation domain-containing protein